MTAARSVRLFANWVGILGNRAVRMRHHPFYLNLETTNDCVLQCDGCYTPGQHRAIGSMDFDNYTKLINDLSARKFYGTLLFQGGEPLLHPRILDMIKVADRAGITTSMVSNGVLLDRPMAAALLDSGLKRLSISIGAVDRQGYETYTHADRFDLVVGNILGFLNAKISAGRRHPLFFVTFVEGQLSHEQEHIWHRYFTRLPIDGSSMIERMNWGGLFPIDKPISRHRKCNFPWKAFYIKHGGEVCPCYFDTECKVIAGNAFNENFWDILNAAPMQKFRSCILKGNMFENGFCPTCNIKDLRSFQVYRHFGDLFVDCVRLLREKTGFAGNTASSIKLFSDIYHQKDFPKKRMFLQKQLEKPDLTLKEFS